VQSSSRRNSLPPSSLPDAGAVTLDWPLDRERNEQWGDRGDRWGNSVRGGRVGASAEVGPSGFSTDVRTHFTFDHEGSARCTESECWPPSIGRLRDDDREGMGRVNSVRW